MVQEVSLTSLSLSEKTERSLWSIFYFPRKVQISKQMNNLQSQTKVSASIRTRVQMWILPHSFHKQHKLRIKQKMCYICSTHSKNNWSIYGICIDSASPREVTQSNFNSSEKKKLEIMLWDFQHIHYLLLTVSLLDIVLNTHLLISQYLQLLFYIEYICVLIPARKRILLKISKFTREADSLCLQSI